MSKRFRTVPQKGGEAGRGRGKLAGRLQRHLPLTWNLPVIPDVQQFWLVASPICQPISQSQRSKCSSRPSTLLHERSNWSKVPRMPGSRNLGLESRKVKWVGPTSGGSSFLRGGATENGYLGFEILLKSRQVRALPTTLSLTGLCQLRWRKEEEGWPTP